jgi:glucose-1-phosphate thymidylyltransferase
VKGLILSGGKGTRLRPITHTSAKQLVPVANKPILFYAIEALRDAGVTDIGIVVGDTRDEIRAAVGDGSAWGIALTFIDQQEPLGLAHAVKVSQEYLGDSRFIMYLGDNLVKGGVAGVVEEFSASDANAEILLAHVPNPQEFGVAEVDGHVGPNASPRVLRLVEKPKEPKSDLALVGVYLFDSTVHEAIADIRPSFRGELEITDAIQHLIDSGRRVVSHVIDGWWKDTGKLEDLLEANRIVLEELARSVPEGAASGSRIEGRVSVGPGARIVNSVVRGPAIIGRDVVIEDAYVGPFTSISDGVTIRGSEIEHSIVLEGSSILHIDKRIEGSLIGKNAEVVRGDGKPSAYRLMLGDSSRVAIG